MMSLSELYTIRADIKRELDTAINHLEVAVAQVEQLSIEYNYMSDEIDRREFKYTVVVDGGKVEIREI